MTSNYIVAGVLVGSVVVGLAAYSAHPDGEYCPRRPSPVSITSLFVPCQSFDSAVGHPVSNHEAVRMGQLTPDERPFPSSQLAELAKRR
jgi:hypothetical protein